MERQQIIVCESRPRWTPELQRQMLGKETRVRGCRSIADLERYIAKRPDSLILLDLAVGAASCLQFLGRFTGRPNRPAVVVLDDLTMAELEWPVRELGAVEFVSETVSANEMMHICNKILCSVSQVSN